MLVLFTSKIDGEISSFHLYHFHKVVEKTADLDAKWKKKNAKPVALDFMVSNEEGDQLFNGTYIVGSEETTNIYDHICQKLVQLPMRDEQQEAERDILLQKLTSHTPASYQIDVTELLKEDTAKLSGWKQFSRRGRIIISSLVGLVMLAIALTIILVMSMSNLSKELEEAKQELADVKTMKGVYEMAMTGDKSEAIAKLQAKEKPSQSEQEVLIHFLVLEKNYEGAVKRTGKKKVSSLASKVMKLHGIDELKKFQKYYPSSAGVFELAYHRKDFEKVIEVEDVPMTKGRYKEKGLAFLNLDQLEEAKKMASEAKNDVLNEKINTYEELEQQLTKINSQIETEKKSKDKQQDKISALKEKKGVLKKEQNNL